MAILSTCATNGAQGQFTSWTNVAGGNFSTPGNWSSGVPTSGSTAQFLSGGPFTVTLDANASFGSMSVANSSTNVTFVGSSSPRLLSLSGSISANNGAQVAFNSPATTISAATFIVTGTGTNFSLNNGTTLTTVSSNINSGTFVVDGTGSSYTGTGVSHRIGISTGITAVITVRNGALADFDSDPNSLLRVGGTSVSNTTGILNVETGGILNAASIAMGAHASPGFSNSSGTINLSGTGSQIVQTGASTLTIGGTGTNNVGNLNINGGSFTTGTGAFTLESGSNVDLNSGTLNANGNLTLKGFFDQTGGQFNLAGGRTLSISNNGVFVTAAAVTNTFNNNTINISGTGSRYTSQVNQTSALVANDSQITLSSNGELTIGSVTLGATTSSNLNASASLLAGANFNLLNGSTAELANNCIGSFTNTTIDGSLSLLSGSSYAATNMVIGNQTNGMVDVNDALVIFAVNGGTALTIGKSSGPTGNLNLSNSTFSTSQGGTMLVNATGQVNAANSTFNLRGLLDINGGTFNQTGGSFIGGANQAITVRNGGNFVTSNAINLTPLTTMTINVNGGTSTFQSQSLNLNSLSSLTLNGGTATSNFAFDGGTVNFNSGTLRHTGSLVMDAATNSTLFGSNATLGIARKMIVDGTATIESPLALGGGRLSVGSIIGGNFLNLDQGTFQLTNSVLTVGGGQFGDVMAINSGLTVETTNTRQSVVAGNGRLFVNGGTFGSAGNLTNNGEIQLNSNLSTVRGGNLLNNSMILGTGRIENNLQNNVNGIIQASGSDRLVFNGTSNTNSGNINAINAGRVEFRNGLTNNSGALILSQNANLRFDGGLINNGGLGVSYGTSNVFGDITNNASGIINVSGGGQATFSEDIVQNGTMQIVKVGNTTSSAVVFGGFSGAGGFTGGGDLFAMGDLRPGNSPASVVFGGNLFMGSGTDTFIELAGLSTGRFDQMLVLGDLTLNGSLNVSLLHNYRLGRNQKYQIANVAGNLFGQFAGLGEGALVGNFGEFNLFISYLGGNGNDITLYTSLAKTDIPYLTGGNGGSSHNAVPEPSGLLLPGVTALGLLGQRRRKKQFCPDH